MDTTNVKSEFPLERERLLVEATAKIVAAHIERNISSPEHVAEMIRSVYNTFLATVTNPGQVAKAEEPKKPAVPISKSVHDDYIVCLEDGTKLKVLKRYLRTKYNMSVEEYKKRWGLPSDYPVVAPNYARRRSELAKSIGLGRKSSGNKTTAKIDAAEGESAVTADDLEDVV